MIRIALKRSGIPPRLLSEEEFIHEFQGFEAVGFAGAARGPVSVEAFDAGGRLCWRAHYTSVERLAELARDMSREREMGSPAEARWKKSR